MCGEPSSSQCREDSGTTLDATLLQRLVDQSPMLFAACDPRGVYLYVNDAFATACGLPAAAIVGRRDDAGAVPRLLRPFEPAGAADGSAAVGDVDLDGRRARLLAVRYPVRSARGDVAALGLVASELGNEGELRASLGSAAERNTELLRALEQMERLAYTDRLTGAWNRRHLDGAALIEMARAERHGFPVSVLMLDIDHFKDLNDRLGHPTGDRVLVDLVDCIRHGIRRTDTITRWGGEEFIVLAPDTPLHEAEQLAAKLCDRIAASLQVHGEPVTVSIGVAEYQCGEGFDRWLARVDHALYRAKTGGRNRVDIDPASAFAAAGSGWPPSSPLRLVWRDAYRCGHPCVDHQHQGLFDHANRLFEAVSAGLPQTVALGLTHALVAAITEHFADEERLHGDIGYPDRHAHASEHRALIAKARELLALAEQGALPMAELFQFLAYDIVAQHLLGADRRYFPYLEDGKA